MFVKMLTGPRAGEIVEMKYADAVPLFADSRAEPAYAEIAASAPVRTSIDLAASEAPKKKGKKK
jgi:hypothetical protein